MAPARSRLARVFFLLSRGLRAVVLFLVSAWTTGAIYYALVPWDGLRLALALAFAGFALWALCISGSSKLRRAFACVVALVVVGFALVPPSHDREWATEVAVMPKVETDGDIFRFANMRHFRYRSREDFDVVYEEREVRLSELESIDFFISYWMPGPVGHTFLSFNFANSKPVCISIETRPEKGESYDPLASIFKGYELIYVVGDERDLVGSRTNYRGEDVYLYRVRGPEKVARQLFLEYVRRINQLADRAEWYHLFKSNCTLNIIRYANRAGREGGFDVRHLLNGLIDAYLYDTGRIDTSLPFEEMRNRSKVTGKANKAEGAADFSEQIRAGLPWM